MMIQSLAMFEKNRYFEIEIICSTWCLQFFLKPASYIAETSLSGCEEDDTSQLAIWLSLWMLTHLESGFLVDRFGLFPVDCVLQIIRQS